MRSIRNGLFVDDANAKFMLRELTPRYLNTSGHYCVVKTITTTARGETTRGRHMTYCGAGDRIVARTT